MDGCLQFREEYALHRSGAHSDETHKLAYVVDDGRVWGLSFFSRRLAIEQNSNFRLAIKEGKSILTMILWSTAYVIING
jgi:hypothetical protein